MPIHTIADHTPKAASTAFIADTATLAGGVTLAENTSVWYSAVLRADTGSITVGAGSNVQDNAVLHTGPGLDVTIGRNVSIGHSAVVHGCTVGDSCLIGMHATILNGAVVGVPGKVLRPVTPEQTASIAANAEEYRALARLHAASR